MPIISIDSIVLTTSSLAVPGLAEKRPSVIVGDRILVKHHGSSKPHWWEGFVHKVRLNDGEYQVLGYDLLI
jgi:hypothetical protein